jgi:hypothetical protein
MRTAKLALWVVPGLLALSLNLVAQTSTGTIGGRVVDTSQAIIPGAEVAVHNVATGLARTMLTNEAGIFRFPALPVGRYEVTINMQGFKKAVISNLKLDVDARVDQTVVLEIGQVTDQVTVEGNTVAVNTVTPDLGAVVNEQMVRELPLNGRSFVQLAGIHAGAQPDGHNRSTAGSISRRDGIAVAISGSRPSSTAFIFDGIPFKEHFYGAPGSLQPIDSIQEFKVQKGFFTGRYDSAGVINLVTKSGTNRVHATVWEFLRNDNFDARKVFDPAKLPEFRQNQYGFEIGGPAIRNKLFWYSSYEALRFFRFNQSFAVVPTAAWRQGDFSSIATSLQDPLTGQPFTGNLIPSTRISTFAKRFLDAGFIPLPTAGRESERNNFAGVAPTVQDDDKWLWRGDYTISSTNKLFGRVIYSKSSRVARSPLKGLDDETPLRGSNVVLNWTHVFGPNLLMDARVGLNRAWMALALLPQRDSDPVWSQEFKINNINTSRLCNFPPSADITGIQRFGGRGDCIRPITNDYYYIADMNYTRGKHQMAWGFTFVDKFIQQLAASWTQGAFLFSGVITGNGMADFLLGHPETAQGAVPGAPNRVALWMDGYFEDQIRLTRNFSLTASLRYQYHPWYGAAGSTLADRMLSILDTTRPRGGVTFAEHPIANDRNDFAPRAGFAWTPFGKQDFVVRSSFGIFYDETPGNQLGWDGIGPNRGGFATAVSTDRRNPINVAGLFNAPPQFATSGYNEVLDKSAPISLPTLFGPHRRQPYLQTWTLSIQKALPKQIVGEAAYVGQHGLKLSKRVEPNRPLPSTTDTRPIAQRVPYTNFGGILMDDGIAMSHYNALQLSLRRNTGNLSLIAGYTYSKDTAWDDYGPWKNYALYDSGNGRTNWDVPHRFSLSWNYYLPRLEGRPTAMRHLLGGWQLGAITSLESGTPFGVTMSTDRSQTGTLYSQRYPNRLRTGALPADQRTPAKWFDYAAWELPPLNTYGNSGPNILDADGLINQDIALIKNFVLPFLGEGANLQFRAEFFNAFNHPNFRPPIGNIQSAVVGTITSTLDARIIQFGLKLHF